MNDYLQFWQVEQSIFLGELSESEIFRTHGLDHGIPRLLHFAKENFPSVILLIGQAGTGKTSFLKWLIHNLSADTHDLFYIPVLGRETQKGWLIRRVAHYLGVQEKGSGNLQELMAKAAAKLDQLVQEKRRLLVLVDDAQWVGTDEAMADFSVFLNLQSLGARCLSFVIAGDQTFDAKLSEQSSIVSKVVMRLELKPLDLGETMAYIRYRCERAGCPPMFSPEAAQEIFAKTRGVPGLVNILAENCLFEAFQQGSKEIDQSLVQRALAHVSFFGALKESLQVAPEIPMLDLKRRVTESSPALPPPPDPLAQRPATIEEPLKITKPNLDQHKEPPILLSSLFKSDPKPGKT